MKSVGEKFHFAWAIMWKTPSVHAIYPPVILGVIVMSPQAFVRIAAPVRPIMSIAVQVVRIVQPWDWSATIREGVHVPTEAIAALWIRALIV